MRSRCVLKDFATTVRDDVFSPSPSPVLVRGLLLYAAWCCLRVDTSCEMFGRHPKGQEWEGWIWRLHGAINGMRTARRESSEFLAGALTECTCFTRGKLERCLPVNSSSETRVVCDVDDPLTCATRATLDKLWIHIAKLVVIKRGEALKHPSHTCGTLGV